MATEKPKKENMTVEDRLSSLWKLQTIYSKIDRIKQIRGDLPLEVKDIDDNIAGLKTRQANYEQEIEDLKKKIVGENEKIAEARRKIAVYNEQLKNIRNNKEYDSLSKEIEFQTLEIELAEKHINEFNHMMDNRKSDIALTQETLEDQKHILEEKKGELEEIVSETRQDEEKLRMEAKKLEPTIDERTLNAYKRIRQNARNGLGIVYVQRDACGGCFNRIPPQKQLEIKMHKKIIVCEYCGRIMIDPALAGVEENKTEE
ncbi:MAG: hypothetical protein J1E99_04200 [Muribaculaceae bacterium]|nr:hypothetical protein [Muribaculaceae bacterium]